MLVTVNDAFFNLAASAYLGEVFLLFLVHCDRPFVGPVYEVIRR